MPENWRSAISQEPAEAQPGDARRHTVLRQPPLAAPTLARYRPEQLDQSATPSTRSVVTTAKAVPDAGIDRRALHKKGAPVRARLRP
jgi:hypothetical protein